MGRNHVSFERFAMHRQPSSRGKVKRYPRAVFRISAFAALAGVSAKLLRAWDSAGLFRPIWVDGASGYRWYSAAQLPELRRILALRDLGVPIPELVRLVAGGDDLAAVLERRRAALETERQGLDRRLRALDIQLAGTTDIVVRPVEAERVATYPVGPEGDEEPAFEAVEAWVRDHGRRAGRPPGTLLDDADRPATVFVPIRGPLPVVEPIEVRRLPPLRVASIIHRGSYAGMPAATEALDRWVRSSGWGPAGPMRIRYLQFGADADLRVPPAYLVERPADLVTEIQRPVA
jgi:DNA-binding transcriptional MerR regulator